MELCDRKIRDFYLCKTCGAQFINRQSIHTHFFGVHFLGHFIYADKLYTCLRCMYCAGDLVELLRHIEAIETVRREVLDEEISDEETTRFHLRVLRKKIT